jgi:hypothetical protein
VLVGYGVSQGGQRWIQRFGVSREKATVDLSLPARDFDHGHGIESRLPIVFVMQVSSGYRAPDGAEIDGATSARIRTLRIQLGAHRTLVIHPHLAAAVLRHRFTFLRNLRFFVDFHAGPETPTRVSAYDRTGKQIHVP